MTKIDLQPCPFCGENPELISNRIVICIMCQNADCPASYVEVEADSETEAVSAWNSALAPQREKFNCLLQFVKDLANESPRLIERSDNPAAFIDDAREILKGLSL